MNIPTETLQTSTSSSRQPQGWTDSILNVFQHGFRKHHSTQTQLLSSVYDWVRSLDDSGCSDVIFLDIAKAFDTVPHQRLLLKLNNVGIRGPLLKWTESFLSGRQQRVVIDGMSSEWRQVSSGVPQGSVLGPLLFLIFVNDINVGLSSTVRLFADDCALYRSINDHQDCVQLQHDLQLIF